MSKEEASASSAPVVNVIPAQQQQDTSPVISQEASFPRAYKNCRIRRRWRNVTGSKGANSNNTVHEDLYKLFAEKWSTRGNVRVTNIHVKLVQLAVGAAVGAVIHPSTETLSDWDDMSMCDNYKLFYFSAATIGQTVEFDLEWPSSCAQQVNPPSRELPSPMLWLMVSDSPKLHATVTVTYDCSVMLEKMESVFL